MGYPSDLGGTPWGTPWGSLGDPTLRVGMGHREDNKDNKDNVKQLKNNDNNIQTDQVMTSHASGARMFSWFWISFLNLEGG